MSNPWRYIVQAGLIALLFPVFQGLIIARTCEGVKGINILLMDNSRSVPHLDPDKSRQEVLAEIEQMLAGYGNRLILFGGRNELDTDRADRFISDGWHTDYYFAFEAAVKLRKEYPPDCDVRIIFITDGLMDAFPSDYPEEQFTMKSQAQSHARNLTLQLLQENPIPTYIILLGDRYDHYFMQQISIRANGIARANPLMEKAAEFLNNNGFLFKQFIYPLPPQSTMKDVRKVIRTIRHEGVPRIEWVLLGLLILAVLTFVVMAVRSFPAPGDQEIIQLVEGVSVLIGADIRDSSVIAHDGHARRKSGLQQVTATAHAIASISFQRRNFDFTARGLQGMTKLDPVSRQLLDVDVQKLSKKLDEMEKSGSDEEIIAATDLKYYCSNLDAEKVKVILQAREMARMDIQAADFLKAKVYVALAPDMLEELTEHKVFLTIPSRNLIRAEVKAGQEYQLGKYRVRIVSAVKDSKFSARVVLEYISMPSTLGLKKTMPRALQAILRLRRPRRDQFNP